MNDLNNLSNNYLNLKFDFFFIILFYFIYRPVPHPEICCRDPDRPKKTIHGIGIYPEKWSKTVKKIRGAPPPVTPRFSNTKLIFFYPTKLSFFFLSPFSSFLLFIYFISIILKYAIFIISNDL